LAEKLVALGVFVSLEMEMSRLELPVKTTSEKVLPVSPEYVVRAICGVEILALLQK
jgi:hypothetical protein